MDVSVDYAYKITNGAVRLWGNACDIARNNLPEGWEIVRNTPEYIPPIGAIIQYGGGYFSSYGHTALVWDNSGGTEYITVLEQNWDSLASSPAKLRTEYYKHIQYFIIPPMIAGNTIDSTKAKPVKPKFKAPDKTVKSITKIPKTLKWSRKVKFKAVSDEYGVTVAKRVGTSGNYKYILTNISYQPEQVFYVYQVQNGWARVYSADSNYWVWHERLKVQKVY